MVHDEVKDKSFELELSWVGEGKSQFHLRKRRYETRMTVSILKRDPNT